MSGIAIRPVTRGDAGAIDRTQRECNPVPWGPRLIEATIWAPRSVALMALDGTVPIGYLIAQRLADLWHLMDVGVLPSHRRRGIGRELVTRLMAVAGTDGSDGVTLEVRASNAAAIGLYEELMFIGVGRRPAYYSDNGEDALIMTWQPGPEAA